jgi:hypothetical protein
MKTLKLIILFVALLTIGCKKDNLQIDHKPVVSIKGVNKLLVKDELFKIYFVSKDSIKCENQFYKVVDKVKPNQLKTNEFIKINDLLLLTY